MNKLMVGIGFALSAAVAPLAAQTFSDNFNANAGALNAVPAGWSVTGGTVDIIPVGSQYDFLPGNGRYVDLDGSTNDPGLLARTMTLTGGVQYTASFYLAGNNTGGGAYGSDSVTVSFGSLAPVVFSRAWNDPFTLASLAFTPAVTGNYVLSFQNDGNNNVGALLDNVNVVPEPEAYGLALAGMGVVAMALRRRQRVALDDAQSVEETGQHANDNVEE